MLAEGIKGGFAMLYDTFANLETLGVCRRGYFIEGMGGAQFALPGAVERLRAGPADAGERRRHAHARDRRRRSGPALRRGAAVAQARGPAERRARRASPARYVVLVEDEPVLYVERGGRGLVTLADAREAAASREPEPLREALVALADAVRAGRVRQARARADRRRAGDRLEPRRAARRARLPLRARAG